jgi:hypothetical protein
VVVGAVVVPRAVRAEEPRPDEEPGRVVASVREVDCEAADDEVDDEVDESEAAGSAHAMPALPATAAPTPRAAASTPTRPT